MFLLTYEGVDPLDHRKDVLPVMGYVVEDGIVGENSHVGSPLVGEYNGLLLHGEELEHPHEALFREMGVPQTAQGMGEVSRCKGAVGYLVHLIPVNHTDRSIALKNCEEPVDPELFKYTSELLYREIVGYRRYAQAEIYQVYLLGLHNLKFSILLAASTSLSVGTVRDILK